ncbi:MAG: hypothetical protein A3D18_04355 [Chlamydiae bacterium RIFCSPHIGHO2_02_FULL_49_29]|nr:MAG: hypothetical protein A3D18_04355 [Chlamydiae bacterium RIFCSPHIGHO2_02_FULL_49_29]
MLVIPLVVSALISSIGNLLNSKMEAGFIKKIISIIFIGFFIASICGILLALIGKPGKGLNIESKINLGKIINKYESGSNFFLQPEAFTSVKQENAKIESFVSIISSFIPNNIFFALKNGDNIKIIFFSIIFGISMGIMRNKNNIQLIKLSTGVYKSISKIIHFALNLIPFALLCLISNQVALMGVTVLYILLKYLVVFFVFIILLFSLGILIISIINKIKFFQIIDSLKEPLLIAFGSQNSYIALPSTLNALHKNQHLDFDKVNLVLPLGISMYSFGSALILSFNVIFFLQIFDIAISYNILLITVFGSIVITASSIGIPFFSKLPLFSIFFSLLGIPIAPAVAIILTLKPFTRPFIEVLSLLNNCILTSLASKAIINK